jgi:phosphonate transport system substrate-binding protein
MGQKRSILGLVRGDFEVTALSDDKLQSMLKSGSAQATDYRVIYESQVIPRLTFGYVHRLGHELAARVTTAALEFENADGPADETTARPMRFLAVDYKRDFEFVRRIDDSFDPRFGKTSKVGLTP